MRRTACLNCSQMNNKLFTQPIFIFLCLILGTWGCSDPWAPVHERQKEVIEMHDTAMAKMDRLYELRKQLKSELDIETADTNALNPERIQHLQMLISDLKTADEGMMEWMRAFEIPKQDQNKEDALAYLKTEMDKIQSVNLMMDKSISAAEDALHPQP